MKSCKKKELQERSAMPKEEGDANREYNGCMKRIS